MDGFSKTWRLELFFKSSKELQEKCLPLLKEHSIQRLNITNKTKDDKLIETTSCLSRSLKTVNVCVHYSLKWNYEGGVEPAYATLKTFLRGLERVPGDHSVLLVSGGGKKKKLETVAALRRLSKEEKKFHVPLHVAFNPYLPDAKAANTERQRLTKKLATGLVAGIWLQTGSDVKMLESGLEFLEKELSSSRESVEIYGSFFMPNKQLLSQMKIRPWNGVFLSSEYLSSVEAATKVTRELLDVYRDHNVVPLLETALRSTKDVRSAMDLLGLS